MNPYAKQTVLGLLSGGIILAGAASASEVYKWADVDGVTHYSEVPPESELASMEILEMTVATPAEADTPDYQSILDVANSLEASRLERERLRIEKTKLRLQEEQTRNPDPERKRVENTYPVATYYYPRVLRHHRKKPYGDRHSRPGRGLKLKGSDEPVQRQFPLHKPN